MTSDDTTAVLFDIDGTLVDSTYHHAIAWQRAFDRHDLPIPLWRIHRTVGMGGDKLVGEVAGDEVERDLGDALRDAWKQEYVELKAEVDPLPGAAELVRRLAQAGHLVALASSGDPDFAEEALDDLEIRDVVEGPADLGRRGGLQAGARPDRGDPRGGRHPPRGARRGHAVRRDLRRACGTAVHRVALRRLQRGRADRGGGGAGRRRPADLLDVDLAPYLSRPIDDEEHR